jgi:glycosyltransferase involved in cell wall biosynthesis
LKALAEWAVNHDTRGVELWIAGDGPMRSALASFAAPSNLEIRMLGHVPYDRLPEIFRQCGILAFPSLADEWGMVVVEAMASAMPVLGSIHSQAVEELVSDRETGWIFNPNEAQEMEEAIASALTTPIEVLNNMGALARERVRQLTPAAMADQIEAAMDYASADRS